ncbi:hypothetical protein [Nocardia miyunensis]|uniref:hypothetical protein n=1 Tax=Nocardia miyunensis TaxID=282684 RepID=UPI00082D9E3D
MAAVRLRGSDFRGNSGETKAAIEPLISTPSTRQGTARTKTPVKTVAAVRGFGVAPIQPVSCPWKISPSASNPAGP